MTTRLYIVGKKARHQSGMDIPVAAFPSREAGALWAENANAWYGEDHPLTPLTVWSNDILLEPSPFPVEALRKMAEGEAAEPIRDERGPVVYPSPLALDTEPFSEQVYLYEYAGFMYEVHQTFTGLKLRAFPGQHPAAAKEKHLRAAEEEYIKDRDAGRLA